jgi:hypothetical protein
MWKGEKRRQDRRRSDKYPVTIENTNNPNTAKARSITITGLPSKRLLTLQPPCQPLASPFQCLTPQSLHSSVESNAHICHPNPTPAISSYNFLPITPYAAASRNTGFSLCSIVCNTGPTLCTFIRNTGFSLCSFVRNTGLTLCSFTRNAGFTLRSFIRNTGFSLCSS